MREIREHQALSAAGICDKTETAVIIACKKPAFTRCMRPKLLYLRLVKHTYCAGEQLWSTCPCAEDVRETTQQEALSDGSLSDGPATTADCAADYHHILHCVCTD